MKPNEHKPKLNSEQVSHELLGQITSSVAHDIHKMLSIIAGEAKLLELKTNRNSVLVEHVESIHRAVAHASQLLMQLLNFGRKRANDTVKLSLSQLIQDIYLILQHIVGDSIELECNLSVESPPVEVNRGLLEQAIINLILNAKEAMPNGGTITMDSTLLETPLEDWVGGSEMLIQYVVLRISDTGMGMNPEVRDRAFDPYFSTKPHGKGSGLGLYNVREIMKQHGGFVDLSTDQGVGTSISLCFPITKTVLQSQKKQF